MHQVAVHWIDLDSATATELRRWCGQLDGEERARAERFRLDRDRRRYIGRHGWLRELLAQRLDVAPRHIRLARNRFGKPSLPGANVGFNLSHSAGRALCVIAQGLELGCDLERLDPALATHDVAERFFSRREQGVLSALPQDRWVEGFFNCWTRKEAFLKAQGVGLGFPLDAFDVSVAPGEPAQLLRGCAGWSVRALEPAPGFAAAVVAEGSEWLLEPAAGFEP